jgi:hypothetical protein
MVASDFGRSKGLTLFGRLCYCERGRSAVLEERTEVVPVFREAGPDAKNRLLQTSKGFQQRQIYRDNLAKLGPNDMWEVAPEGEETIRKLKVNIRRAANELSMNVRYGETTDGTLLVWVDNQRERTGRRGRPRKSPETL